MAYFANGDEGDFYESAICKRCAHYKDADSGDTCPIWMLHLIYNYDQNKDEAVETVLGTLIPRRGIRNDLCTMYHPSKPEYASHGDDYKEWLAEQERKK